MEWFILSIGILALSAAIVPMRLARRWWIRFVAGLLLLAAVAITLAGGVLVWYMQRPLPRELSEILFEGITYRREVRSEPRPLVLHAITVDLDAPGLGVLVTPPEPYEGRQLRARTTSQFLTEFELQLAINGSFFEPWWTRGFWD